MLALNIVPVKSDECTPPRLLDQIDHGPLEDSAKVRIRDRKSNTLFHLTRNICSMSQLFQ
ncbi:hypothetical protein HanRHA438_Chr02g0065891 [Helianthus annuus]|nr:hypothetical protein HanRHA438_Chr02g0065891 [Helianthus annuus]